MDVNIVHNTKMNSVPFEDTVVVNDLEDDIVGFSDYDQNARTQIVSDCEEEVVLDSDDVGARRADVQGEASWDVDFVPDSDASDGEQGGVVCSPEKRRSLHGCSRQASNIVSPKTVSKLNEVQPTSLWTHTRTKKQIGLKNEEISKLRKQYLVDDIVPIDPKVHDNFESRRGSVEDQVVDNNNNNNNNTSPVSNTRSSDRENSRRLDYVGYEEPGESPETKALKFVDHFVSCNNVELSQISEPRETVRNKSPPSSSKGFQTLAKRINVMSTRETGSFEWTEVHQDGVAGSSSKKNGMLFDARGQMPRSITGTTKARKLENNKGSNSVDKFEEKKDFPIEAGHLGKQVDTEPLKKQSESCGGGNGMQDMFDGVFNTQMAADVMETLLYVLPAELSSGFSLQDPQSTSNVGSSRGLTKNMVPKSSSDIKLGATKKKKINPRAGGLEKATQSSGQKPRRKRIQLNDDLTIRSKKEGDAIVKGSGSSSNVRKTSVVRSCSLMPAVERDCNKSKDFERGEFALSSISIDPTPREKPSETVCEPRLSTSLSSSDTMNDLSVRSGEKTGDIMQHGFSTYKRKRRTTPLSSLERMRGLPIASEENMSDVLQKGFCTYRRKRSSVLSLRGEHPNSICQAGPLTPSSPSEMMKGLPVTCGEKSSVLMQPAFVTYKRRQLTSLGSLDNMKNLQVISEETRRDAVQHGFRTYTRKRSSVLSGRRDCPNNSRILGEPRNSKTSEEQANGATASPITSLALNAWSYTKGKRTLRAKNQTRPCSVIDGNNSPYYVIKERKCSDGDVIKTCFSLEMKGKSKSSDVRNKDMKQINSCRRCTATRSGKDDSLVAISFMGDGDHRQPCKSNQPRMPLLRELIQLGIPELFSDSSTKDLRRRRSTSNIQVLFSQHLDDDIVKQQKKVLARIGISLASCSADATHFVTDRFVRTRNMLEAIALGKPILSYLWLESCGQASCLIDEKNYILKDVRKETELGFSLPVSLARARQRPLLQGQRIYITPNIKPDQEMIASLVKTVHGEVVDDVKKIRIEVENIPEDLLVLTCEEDYKICVPFLDKGVSVYSSELLLNGIVIQKLQYERHQLFADRVKQRRC